MRLTWENIMPKKTSSTKIDEISVRNGEVHEVIPPIKDPVEAKLDLLIDLVTDRTTTIPFQGLDMSRYRFKD